MPDRYEFTAPDGSRRWCSRELLGAERFIETCGNFRISGDYCGTCSALRIRSLAILKPQPSGLRWEMEPHRWVLTCAPDGDMLWCVWKDARTGLWRWDRDKSKFDTLSACAHALVDAVKETR